MVDRKLHRENYEKAMSYITPKTEWETEVLKECYKLFRNGCNAKNRETIENWFDHLDFRLAETFRIKVAID